MQLYETLAQWHAEGRAFVLATVVRVRGSVPRPAGAKMLVPASGEPLGTVGGGVVENETIRSARELLASGGSSRTLKIDLGAETACGGEVELFLEPHRAERRLVVIGAGHVGQAVARQMVTLGWDVTVMDPRAEFLARPEFAGCHTVLTQFVESAEQIPFSADLFVLVMTPHHEFDRELASRCIAKPWRWLGVMASKRKAEAIRRHLLAQGAPPEQVARLRSPVGIEIGSETPAEIAVSIAAELIQVTAKKPLPPDAARPGGVTDQQS